jgi:acyl-CoA reductase-like NAD-dependent aldehyde dehydrogenase
MTAITTPAPILLGGQPGVLIGGDWINTPSTRPVDDPATGDAFTAVPEATGEHVDAAMAAAVAAQKRWARRSHPDRAEALAAQHKTLYLGYGTES